MAFEKLLKIFKSPFLFIKWDNFSFKRLMKGLNTIVLKSTLKKYDKIKNKLRELSLNNALEVKSTTSSNIPKVVLVLLSTNQNI